MLKSGWRVFFGACAIIFLIPTIILLIYSHSLTGEFFPVRDGIFSSLSKNSSTWGEFGSLLSGLFGLSSALATMLTLGFVIHQFQKSIARSDEKDKEIEKEREKNESLTIENNEKVAAFHNDVIRFHNSVSDFQSKIIEFNENQKTRDNFEKYKLHKEMFNDLINNLEIDLRDFYGSSDVKIIKKQELYTAIFPLNSFSFSTHNASLNSSDNNSKFNSIQAHLNGIFSWIRRQEAYEFKRLLFNYLGLLNELNIYIPHNPEETACIYEISTGRKIFNIKKFMHELSFLVSICNKLVLFTENKEFKAPVGETDPFNLESRLVLSGQTMLLNKSEDDIYMATSYGYSPGEASLFHTYAKIRLSGMQVGEHHHTIIANLRNILYRIQRGTSEKNKAEALAFFNDVKEEIKNELGDKNLIDYGEFTPTGLLFSAYNHLNKAISEYSCFV